MKLAIHSFKGGTGKSTIAANLAYVFAKKGYTTCMIDCDLVGAGIHILFGIKKIERTINDILWGRCKIQDAVLDISERLGLGKGKLLFIPASVESSDILKIINEGYDPVIMNEVFKNVFDVYGLDFMIIDTHPGISSDILLTLVACNPIILSVRYDYQDLLGASIALEMIKRFGRRAELLLNMVPIEVSFEEVRKEVKKLLKYEIVSIIPFYGDLLLSKSKEVFVFSHPDHDFSKIIEGLSERFIELKGK